MLRRHEKFLGQKIAARYTFSANRHFRAINFSSNSGYLERPSIVWQLLILGSSQSNSTAFLSSLDTYATRLLTEPLTRVAARLLQRSALILLVFEASTPSVRSREAAWPAQGVLRGLLPQLVMPS